MPAHRTPAGLTLAIALAAGALTACNTASTDTADRSGRTQTTTRTEGGERRVTQTARTAAPVGSNTVYYPSGDRQGAVLAVDKSAPAEVQAGRPFDYTIRVTNLTDGALEDVTIYDQLDQGFTMSNSSPRGMMEDGADGRAMFDLGRLNAGETKTITVTGSAEAPGTLESCASVSYTLPVCTTVLVVQPALAITKTAPATVTVCDPIPVRIVVTNAGTGEARNIRVRDSLPAGLLTTDGRNAIEIDGGTLAAGQSREFTVNLKADRAGSFANVANATADGDLEARSASTTTVVTQPELALESDCPEGILIGREATFRFTLTNSGDTVANGTTLTAGLPAGSTFSNATEGGANDGGRVTWNLGNLAAGASRSVNMTVRSGAAGTLATTATATATCAQQVTADCSVPVQGVPDIGTSVEDFNGVVLVGDNHTYTYLVKNQGQVNLTGIRLRATLTEGSEFVSSTAATPPRVAGRNLEFAVGDLAPGQERTFTITIVGRTAGEQGIDSETSCNELKRTVRHDEQVTYVDR